MPVLVVPLAKVNGSTLNPRESGQRTVAARDKCLGVCSEVRSRKQTCSSNDDKDMNTQKQKSGSYVPDKHKLVYTSYLFSCLNVYKWGLPWRASG